jgi:hypothetical protein
MAKPRPYVAPAEIILTGEGPSQAQLIFITAEASSKPASELLHKMIEAMGLKKTDVLIAHFDEGGSLKMSELQPQIIVALGETISRLLLASSATIADLRGIFKPFKGAKLIATFHPEDLLKKPDLKKSVWADLQNVAKELGISIPSRK